MAENGRRDSLFRAIFASAAEGQKTPIAIDTWPLVGSGTALSKLDRCLGPAGDLNPPFALLDHIAAYNPEGVARAVCEALGFEPPRKRAPDPAAVLDAVLEAGQALDAQYERLKELIESIPAPEPVKAVRRRGAA